MAKITPNGRGNMTLDEFMRWAAVRRTKTYEEIGAGRLIALKCGNRTLIPIDAAEAWRAALPRLKGATVETGGADG